MCNFNEHMRTHTPTHPRVHTQRDREREREAAVEKKQEGELGFREVTPLLAKGAIN